MRLRFLSLVLLTLTAFPSVTLAQNFSFGFSSGGHHHGHHGCYGGSWYGFSLYRPAPLYVYPPPPVYMLPPVTYVYPAPAVQMVQQPALSQAPAPAQSATAQLTASSTLRTNSVPAQQRSNVVLHNPAENAGPVAFRVQDQVDAELGPGTSRTWNDRTTLTVEFDRGGSYGSTRKILRPGAYDFVVTEEGWDLVATVNPTAVGRAASLQKNSLPPRR